MVSRTCKPTSNFYGHKNFFNKKKLKEKLAKSFLEICIVFYMRPYLRGKVRCLPKKLHFCDSFFFLNYLAFKIIFFQFFFAPLKVLIKTFLKSPAAKKEKIAPLMYSWRHEFWWNFEKTAFFRAYIGVFPKFCTENASSDPEILCSF